MRTLLWKELREKRLWIIPLVISTVGVVLLGWGYTFCGVIYNFTPLIGASALVALLMGTGTYSRELSGDTADFLYSRPVSWKRILVSKLMVGLGIILAAALLAAVVYRVTVPEPYVRFATPTDLLRGVGMAMLVMGIPYLIASFTSVVLPGMIGGILMLIATCTVVGIEIFLSDAAYDRLGCQPDDMTVLQGPFMAMYAWPIALIAAGLLIARFGLTLTTKVRALRYTLISLAIVAVLSPLDFLLKDTINGWLCRPTLEAFSISPTERYVLVSNTPDSGYTADTLMVRLADGKRADGVSTSLNWGYWSGDKRYNIMNSGGDGQTYDFWIGVSWMDQDGRIASRSVPLGRARWMKMQPSYDGRYAAIVIAKESEAKERMLKFADIDKGVLLNIPPITTSDVRRFWVSDTEYVYYDDKGARHTVVMRES